MLRPEHPLDRAPAERQSPRRVAQRMRASGKTVHAAERVRMLRTEHPLAAVERAPAERQNPAAASGFG